MRAIEKRLKNLEGNVLEPIEPGSTKISLVDLPEAERQFLKKTQDIVNFIELENWTEQDRFLVLEANKRLTHRIIDLFTTWLNAYYQTKKFGTKKLVIQLRFWFFLMELQRHIHQIEVEEAYMKKHKKFKDFEKAMNEWEARQENKTPLWTRESFSYFFDNCIVRGFKEHQEKHRRRTRRVKSKAS